MKTISHPTRRRILKTIAITAAGGALVPQALFAQGSEAAKPGGLLDGDVCLLTPDVTQGPYYFDPELVRSDITEGRPGVPVTFALQIVDSSCAPQPGARVDIWHCDAGGLYSNYSGQGDDREHPASTKDETFLRGTQIADARGIVRFRSIYPGWYHGRTTHVHFKVFLDDNNVLTGQIFFPDALSEFIYENVAPYSARGYARDTLNRDDDIARQATRASFAEVKEDDAEYVVSLIIGVKPDATSRDAGGGGGPPYGPPPGAGGRPPPPPEPKAWQGDERIRALMPGEDFDG